MGNNSDLDSFWASRKNTARTKSKCLTPGKEAKWKADIELRSVTTQSRFEHSGAKTHNDDPSKKLYFGLN